MAKSYEDYGYLEKDRALRSAADDYNIDWKSYQPEDRGSAERFRYKDLEKDLLVAAANDYDLRMSTQAAKQGGYEGASDLPSGYDTMDDYFAGRAFQESVFNDNDLGNTYNGPYGNDAAGVTNFLVNYNKDAQTKSSTQTEPSIDPITITHNFGFDGKGTKKDYEAGIQDKKNSIKKYENAFTTVGDRFFPGSEADDFSNAYKKEVIKGLQKANIATRGPGSGFNGEGF